MNIRCWWSFFYPFAGGFVTIWQKTQKVAVYRSGGRESGAVSWCFLHLNRGYQSSSWIWFEQYGPCVLQWNMIIVHLFMNNKTSFLIEMLKFDPFRSPNSGVNHGADREKKTVLDFREVRAWDCCSEKPEWWIDFFIFLNLKKKNVYVHDTSNTWGKSVRVHFLNIMCTMRHRHQFTRWVSVMSVT